MTITAVEHTDSCMTVELSLHSFFPALDARCRRILTTMARSWELMSTVTGYTAFYLKMTNLAPLMYHSPASSKLKLKGSTIGVRLWEDIWITTRIGMVLSQLRKANQNANSSFSCQHQMAFKLSNPK